MGPSMETVRIKYLTQILTNDMTEWLYNQVLSPYHQQHDWTFKDVIISLYQHFVVTDIYQKAKVKFYNVWYDPKQGITCYGWPVA